MRVDVWRCATHAPYPDVSKMYISYHSSRLCGRKRQHCLRTFLISSLETRSDNVLIFRFVSLLMGLFWATQNVTLDHRNGPSKSTLTSPLIGMIFYEPFQLLNNNNKHLCLINADDGLWNRIVASIYKIMSHRLQLKGSVEMGRYTADYSLQ